MVTVEHSAPTNFYFVSPVISFSKTSNEVSGHSKDKLPYRFTNIKLINLTKIVAKILLVPFVYRIRFLFLIKYVIIKSTNNFPEHITRSYQDVCNKIKTGRRSHILCRLHKYHYHPQLFTI